MKKFLLYVVVAVTLLFLGFTVYYIAQNDENIYLKIDNSKTIYRNVTEYIEWPIEHEKPYKDTTLSVVVGDENVVQWDSISKRFSCVGGGRTNVTITSSNKNFGPFVFEVNVGNGMLGSPFMIQTAEDLKNIGTGVFETDLYYELADTIDIKSLGGEVFTTIPEFSGHFNGNGHSILNLNLASGENAGLFGTLSSTAVVENVKFDKVAINGEYSRVGVVAGTNYGLIGKIDVNGTINNSKTSGITGGIVGVNSYDKTTASVNMCSTEVEISACGTAGGIAGINKSSIILNCKAITKNATLAEGSLFGGIVGENISTFASEQYFPCAIVKSYSIINGVSAGAQTGAVVGLNTENNNSNSLFANEYKGVIYALGNEINMTASSLGNIENVIEKNKEDLKLDTTYIDNSYDLANVWTLAENDYAKLNFAGSYETIIVKSETNSFDTNTMPSIKEFLDAIKADKTISSVYYVTEPNQELDLNGEAWTTIAPNPNEPFIASIEVNEGASLTIKNFKLTGNNSSFFGYISSNAKIVGIKFENVIVEENTSENLAIVANNVASGSAINGVEVSDVTVNNASAKNFGIITASNQGSVVNSTVSGTNNIKIKALAGTEKTVGGIVGCNYGNVSSNNVNSFNLEISEPTTEANFSIGGIAGLTETNVNNCKVNSFILDSSNSGLMYVGGVVGKTTTNENSAVIHSYSKASISLNLNNENTFIGGVVGYLAVGSKVTESAYADGTLRAYNVGGIVAVCDGEITKSYAQGNLKGVLVGGLATTTHGKIENCYTLSALYGENRNSKVNGITNVVGEHCVIDRCLSSASFNGEGSRFAESATEFRPSWLSKWMANLFSKREFGSVSNLVIVNYGDAKIQSSILEGKKGWVDVTDEDCKGANEYAVLKDNAHFAPEIWNFENVGSYPTLKDAIVVE